MEREEPTSRVTLFLMAPRISRSLGREEMFLEPENQKEVAVTLLINCTFNIWNELSWNTTSSSWSYPILSTDKCLHHIRIKAVAICICMTRPLALNADSLSTVDTCIAKTSRASRQRIGYSSFWDFQYAKISKSVLFSFRSPQWWFQ